MEVGISVKVTNLFGEVRDRTLSVFVDTAYESLQRCYFPVEIFAS